MCLKLLIKAFTSRVWGMKINLISYAKLTGKARGFRTGRWQGQRSKGRQCVRCLGHFTLKNLKNSKTAWLARKGRRELLRRPRYPRFCHEREGLALRANLRDRCRERTPGLWQAWVWVKAEFLPFKGGCDSVQTVVGSSDGLGKQAQSISWHCRSSPEPQHLLASSSSFFFLPL